MLQLGSIRILIELKLLFHVETLGSAMAAVFKLIPPVTTGLNTTFSIIQSRSSTETTIDDQDMTLEGYVEGRTGSPGRILKVLPVLTEDQGSHFNERSDLFLNNPSTSEINLVPPFSFPSTYNVSPAQPVPPIDPSMSSLSAEILPTASTSTSTPSFKPKSKSASTAPTGERKPTGRPKGVLNKTHVPLWQVKERRRLAQRVRRAVKKAEEERRNAILGSGANVGKKRGRPRKDDKSRVDATQQEPDGVAVEEYAHMDPELLEDEDGMMADIEDYDGLRAELVDPEDRTEPHLIEAIPGQHTLQGMANDLDMDLDISNFTNDPDSLDIDPVVESRHQDRNHSLDQAVMQGDINMMALPAPSRMPSHNVADLANHQTIGPSGIRGGTGENIAIELAIPGEDDDEAGLMQYMQETYTITLDALERAQTAGIGSDIEPS